MLTVIRFLSEITIKSIVDNNWGKKYFSQIIYFFLVFKCPHIWYFITHTTHPYLVTHLRMSLLSDEPQTDGTKRIDTRLSAHNESLNTTHNMWTQLLRQHYSQKQHYYKVSDILLVLQLNSNWNQIRIELMSKFMHFFVHKLWLQIRYVMYCKKVWL